MRDLPPGVADLRDDARRLGWVVDLFVGGSAAAGDYVLGVSDLDLVAVTAGEVDQGRRWALVSLHEALDGGAASGLNLGCQYVDERSLTDLDATHPTWTHGRMVDRALSGITRAELVRNGYAVLGRDPQGVLPSMTDDDVRSASIAELNGYWARAARRPWWWLNPAMVDLGLTSMARGRHALSTGQLLTKTRAIEACRASPWLVDQMQARRQGQDVTSPRLRSAWLAWQDVSRTTRLSRHTSREVNRSTDQPSP